MFLKKGSRDMNVKYLQYGLRIMCINPGNIDGIFGDDTFNAVKKFQSRFGLDIDGILGDNTWNRLKTEIKPIQSALRNHRYNISVDGVAGPDTFNAILNFQKKHGLSADGMVGTNTKAKLFNSSFSQGFSSSYKYTSNSNELEKFINIAETQLGITETGNNITKYGAWYGLNGDPWCAMFVSWCANEAGILDRIVPKYASCTTGAEWYRTRERYKTRESGYIPKTGDIIFFNRQGGIHHTGLIIELYIQ